MAPYQAASRRWFSGVILLVLLAQACGNEPATDHLAARSRGDESNLLEVRDTTVEALLSVSSVAEPVLKATLSTRVAGTITGVLVQEGESVRAGQVLVRVDARDLAARHEQVAAAVTGAEAEAADAEIQVARFRSLYADSAATRAQLEAVETRLAQAQAGLRAAQAGAREVSSMEEYSVIRAPFAGVITQRLVDPGDFAAPGVPLVTIIDGSRLRIAGRVSPSVARGLTRGARLDARIEQVPAVAIVEGISPGAGAVYTVNAIVENPRGMYAPGGAAELSIRSGSRTAILIPVSALVRQGDLVGVRVMTGAGPDLRWLRLGDVRGETVEVLSGIRAGDRVEVKPAEEGER